MTHTEALALGILQGATEFLPVSSSGHLVLAEHFGQVQGAGLAFDVFLHLGTLLAVLIYFRKDWWAMFTFWRAEKTYQRLLFYLLLATVPGALVGFLGEDLVARHFRDPLRVAY
ncbi:MAG TPA: undecaprenyl-diphosphate phosphatase, partial [Thermodesulfatator atlanticus]|nr:undecaprenyl-diphosphate phosphatase [Thermodesulfatator atlanticus]